MDFDVLLTTVKREGSALLAAVDRDPGAPVEHCPDWDNAALAEHLRTVWTFMATQVSAARPEKASRPDADDGSTAAERLDALVLLLSGTDPGAPCWNWCPEDGRTVSWMVRRMAHENSMHRWDAENAVGEATLFDGDLARDAVDEILDVAWQYGMRGPVSGYPTSTLHLHRTDGEGEWMLSSVDDHLVVGHEHAKGDVAVRGTAPDLALLVWGRRRPTVEVFGDEAALDAWLALTP